MDSPSHGDAVVTIRNGARHKPPKAPHLSEGRPNEVRSHYSWQALSRAARRSQKTPTGLEPTTTMGTYDLNNALRKHPSLDCPGPYLLYNQMESNF